MPFGVGVSLLEHAFEIRGSHFDAYGTVYCVTDFENALFERPAFFCDQRGIGSDSVENAHFLAFANFLYVCGI